MELYEIFRRSAGVNTDSRTVQPGQLFFALKGENFDGNAYALGALEAGACAAVVTDGPDWPADGRLIRVPDTLQALKDLAAWHRSHVLGEGKHLPVIGLTGTNGKTTTKELIREVLAAKYRVTATAGNFNNDVGVPLSLLRITPETQIAVIEMGANHPDDIGKLVKVSQPDFGLITNVGKAHLLGFGSLEGVMAAKGQLYDWIAAHDGVVFVNADDERLVGMARKRSLSLLPYGLQYDGAEILPTTGEEPFLRLRLADGTIVRTQLVGSYNAPNVLAALAVGAHFEVPLEDAVAAIAAYVPSNNRSQMVRTGRGNCVIVDAYNANPSSMAVALDNFAAFTAERKVVMLGSMGELGADSAAEHAALVRRLLDMDCQVFLVGEAFADALHSLGMTESSLQSAGGSTPSLQSAAGSTPSLHGLSVQSFPDSAALAAYVGSHPLTGAAILLKGSRSQKMEVVLPEL